MSKVKWGKVESSSRIRHEYGRVALEEEEVRRILKYYFRDLYNLDTKEEYAVQMCSFDGVQGGNYFRGEPIRRFEEEVKVGKLKNGKVAGKDEVIREKIKDGGDIVVHMICKMCDMAFESGVVPKD